MILIVVFIVVILNALGMALFHIAENQELNQVTDDGPLMLAPYSMFFGADWSAVSSTP